MNFMNFNPFKWFASEKEASSPPSPPPPPSPPSPPSPTPSLVTVIDSQPSDIPAEERFVPVQSHMRRISPKKPTESMTTDTPTPTPSQDGTQIALGYGFATSDALTRRGFEEGSRSRSMADLEMALELLSHEYHAHIQTQMDHLSEKLNSERQVWSKIRGISEAYDQRINVFENESKQRMAQLQTELEAIEKRQGMIKGIHFAYRRGYTHAVDLGGRDLYIPVNKK